MVKKGKKVKSVTVIGKSWFDRINGNTYQSTEILINGEFVAKVGPVCGYGDYYVQMSQEYLFENGFFPDMEKHAYGGLETFWRYCRERNINLHTTICKTPRKKDL